MPAKNQRKSPATRTQRIAGGVMAIVGPALFVGYAIYSREWFFVVAMGTVLVFVGMVLTLGDSQVWVPRGLGRYRQD
jgi:hypothetical protein